jgi:hypothetical protein
MQPEGSLPCSQEPANYTYPESNESIHITKIHSNPVPHLGLRLPSGMLPSGFPKKVSMQPSQIP